MRRYCLTLISLLAVLTAVRSLAQTPEEFNIQRRPTVEQLPQVPPSQNVCPAAGEASTADSPGGPPASVNDLLANRFLAGTPNQEPLTLPPAPLGEPQITGGPINLDGSVDAAPVVALGDFMGYRYSSPMLEWIPGNAEQFGMFSVGAGDTYTKSGISNGLGIGFGVHFLTGPVQTDMPPRLFDIGLGYQIRQRLGPLAFDLSASVLSASDLEGSFSQGIMYPSHAVGYLTVGPTIDLVFGVDYLDRADIKLLPVAGMVWNPNPDMRFELVFPRPRAVFRLTECYRIYVSGELGGGTWAVQRVAFGNDLATYSDLRVCLGLEHVEKGGQGNAIEIGYLFNRSLEYTSGVGNVHFVDAVMLRLVTRY
jgi:hypothetical protein